MVGRSYKPRSGPERTFQLSDSWMVGLAGAVPLVFFAVCGFANVMNQVVGVPYITPYTVTAKYVVHGKHRCYGLTLTNTGDLTDQLKICVSASQQEATAIRDVLQVSGRRSRYVNQVLGYVRRP